MIFGKFASICKFLMDGSLKVKHRILYQINTKLDGGNLYIFVTTCHDKIMWQYIFNIIDEESNKNNLFLEKNTYQFWHWNQNNPYNFCKIYQNDVKLSFIYRVWWVEAIQKNSNKECKIKSQ